MIGRVVGQFRIVEKLGAGGMGIVYRATDEKLRRDVALKFLPPGMLTDADARRRFHREALALSRLNHPGIATIHDFQTIDDLDFLVMEFIPGESLDQRIIRGPIPEDEAIRLGTQMLEALGVAHRSGVIHRDLKPGNLRVTPDGRLKILDFGLAKWWNEAAASARTLTADLGHADSGAAGTPAYMAPETLSQNLANERSDLYAAGAVMYELTTGSRPFQAPTLGALIQAILTQSPPTLRTLNAAITPALEAVVLRCLDKDPARRPGSAAELAVALRAVSGGGISARAMDASPRRKARPALLAAFAIIAIAALTYVLWRSMAENERPRALAVLPLGMQSGDAALDYWVLTTTDALNVQLQRVSGFRITSMSSVMPYWKDRPPMHEIARRLGVDTVVEGNLLRLRDHLHITVTLVAARQDAQLWTAQFDGDTTDVPGLQRRIVEALLKQIQVNLTPTQRARLAHVTPVNPDARRLYQMGRFQWGRRSSAALLLSIQYFEQALAVDSLYAAAHAGLADAWAEAGFYAVRPPAEAAVRARAEARRAIELDPVLSDGHTSLANVLHNFDWNWSEAEAEYKRAIELNASDALAHDWYAHLLAQNGRFKEARREIARARELDPISVTIALALGSFDYYSRDFASALRAIDAAAQVDSTNALLHRLKAGVLDRLGREGEAVDELARSFELSGQPAVAGALRQTYAVSGMKGALQLLLGGLMQRRSSGSYEPAEHLAEIHARLGNVGEALTWLETAYRERDPELNRLKVDPVFDPLRREPRFQNLLQQVGLGP